MKPLGVTLLPGLVQGPVPPSAAAVAAAGFQFLVLCAEEIQPPDNALVGIPEVMRCPLRDDPTVRLDERSWRRAVRAATAVSLRVRAGTPTLVTCAQGRNRSGLVSALALHMLTSRSGRDCVAYIQSRIPTALTNPVFLALLVEKL